MSLRALSSSAGLFLAGIVVGAALASAYLFRHPELTTQAVTQEKPSICYSCFWQGYDPKLRADVVDFYRQYKTADPLVAADVQYVLWRTSEEANCEARSGYRVGAADADAYRRLLALSALGFSGPECGQSGDRELRKAAEAAREIGLEVEANLLSSIASHRVQPRFVPLEITTDLRVPPAAKAMVLGRSAIEVSPQTIVGAQVERVSRDWISYQMRWNLTGAPIAANLLVPYHEGAFLKQIAEAVPIEILPIAGAIVARHGDAWYAADDSGAFRFEVLGDKLQYPTTHASGNFAWVLDTHGISALVPQAIERHAQLVVGCGDSEGKAKAAFYLAQKGINVVIPGDRYQDLLLGYSGPGVIIGGAPVAPGNGRALIGAQPVRFLLDEPIVVENTAKLFPIQYYDAPARYFRRLNSAVKLNLHYVDVDGPNELQRILKSATDVRATAIAVRIATAEEDSQLRSWLDRSPRNRAILFHSGLYPFAQGLFRDYRQQVTFGDLHPVFE